MIAGLSVIGSAVGITRAFRRFLQQQPTVDAIRQLERTIRKLDKQQAARAAELSLRISQVSQELDRQQAARLEKLSLRLDHVIRAIGRGDRVELNEFLHNHQIGPLETIQRIKRNKMSLARFGDGELRAMTQYGRVVGFQDGSATLERALIDVLHLKGYDEKKLLVALPGPMSGSHYWELQWPELWLAIRTKVRHDLEYGDSYVSRTEFFRHYGSTALDAWKSLWDGEEVFVITGRGSRFDPSPELFSEVRSIRFVHSLPTEAFDDLPRLLLEMAKTVPSGALCLISLGPAGTVLAAELSRMGYWALDIGHISSCVDQWLGRNIAPEKTPKVRSI